MSFAIAGSFLTKLMGPTVCKVFHADICVAMSVVRTSYKHVHFRTENGHSNITNTPLFQGGQNFDSEF